jgi:predicted ester cyclase
MASEDHLKRMKTVDDALMRSDFETFASLHAKDTIVHWPGRPEPTRGRAAHRAELESFMKAFPDSRVQNDPYPIGFTSGEFMCFVSRLTGTFKGPMTGPDGRRIPPNGRTFDVPFSTVARWKDGAIAEEWLFYDQYDLMAQLGLMEMESVRADVTAR